MSMCFGWLLFPMQCQFKKISTVCLSGMTMWPECNHVATFTSCWCDVNKETSVCWHPFTPVWVDVANQWWKLCHVGDEEFDDLEEADSNNDGSSLHSERTDRDEEPAYDGRFNGKGLVSVVKTELHNWDSNASFFCTFLWMRLLLEADESLVYRVHCWVVIDSLFTNIKWFTSVKSGNGTAGV